MNRLGAGGPGAGQTAAGRSDAGRTALGRWLRGGALLGLAGLSAGGLVLAQRTPAAPAPVLAATVLPVGQRAPVTVCPGPETLLVPAGGTAEPAPGPVLVSALTTGTGTLGSLVPRGTPLAFPAANGTGGVGLGALGRTSAGAVRLDVSPASAVGSAVQVTLGRTGDLRGLAATTCAAPSSGPVWLVGGGTGQGRRARLLVANPGAVPAVVDVVPYGPAGPVPAPGGQAVVVPAGREVALFVDAIAPGIDPLALELRARSGRFVAVLHDTLARGTVAGGVDDVPASAAAATRLVVPGLVLAAPGSAAVRVAVPGSVEAVVKVRLLGPDGPVDLGPAASGVVTVPGGAVVDVALPAPPQLPDGTYTALVEADLPVVAGAVVSRTLPGGELAGTPQGLGRTVPPSDLAWAGAASPLRGAVGIAVPALPTVPGVGPVRAELVLAAAERAELVVRQVARDGTVALPQDVVLPAGASLVLALDAGTAGVLVTPPGDPGTGGPAYAALVLQAADAAGPMISVLPVRPGPEPPAAAPQVVADPWVGLG